MSKVTFVAAIVIIAAAVMMSNLESAEGAKYVGRQAYLMREKPRSTRGFKSVSLSTARGFGKRNSPDADQVVKYLQSTPKQSFPIEWVVEVMQNDPDLLRSFIEKFADHNEDNELTMEELIYPRKKPVNNEE